MEEEMNTEKVRRGKENIEKGKKSRKRKKARWGGGEKETGDSTWEEHHRAPDCRLLSSCEERD